MQNQLCETLTLQLSRRTTIKVRLSNLPCVILVRLLYFSLYVYIFFCCNVMWYFYLCIYLLFNSFCNVNYTYSDELNI